MIQWRQTQTKTITSARGSGTERHVVAKKKSRNTSVCEGGGEVEGVAYWGISSGVHPYFVSIIQFALIYFPGKI